MSLYFILLTASGAVPLLLSFDKRLQFYKQWKYVFPSILLVALVYIVFDVNFTNRGIWGFNPEYLSGIYLFSLPLEEILFFVVIPILRGRRRRFYSPGRSLPFWLAMGMMSGRNSHHGSFNNFSSGSGNFGGFGGFGGGSFGGGGAGGSW